MTVETTMSFLAEPPRRTVESPIQFATTTLLPGGGLVVLNAQHHGRAWRVDDGGVGVETLLSLGVFDLGGRDTRRGEAIAERYGLAFDGASFSVDEVSDDQLQAAMTYVADAARAWAEQTLEARASRRRVEDREVVEAKLRRAIPGAKIDAGRAVAGHSSKQHEFDFVIELPGQRLAVFEALTPNPNAVASAYLKFDDVMRAHADWPREALIERFSDWAAPDLAVLQNVASHVRDLEADWSDLGALVAA